MMRTLNKIVNIVIMMKYLLKKTQIKYNRICNKLNKIR